MDFDAQACPVPGLAGRANVLVTGASSGIGLALLTQLLHNRHVARAFAVSRTATVHPALRALEALHGERLHRVDADLSTDAGIDAVGHALRDAGALHLVLNAAGLLHDMEVAPEKSVAQVSRDSLQKVFALNAFAPVLLARALLPQLRHREPAVYATLSARVGSIGDNRSGGWYAYRASKAAQNQFMRTFAIEWRRLNPSGICLMLHPGTVDTPLSSPFRANVPPDRLFDPGLAASRLLAVIASRTREDSGHFFAWDGTPIPW
jgi:NAD(P)-dependent dehydrogenase (short-subunit alcohol dehydrogenase family)